MSMIKKDMNKAEEKSIKNIDINFLFDNFDQFCKVEFEKKGNVEKEPKIIKSLTKVFDKVARDNSASAKASNKMPVPKRSKTAKMKNGRLSRQVKGKNSRILKKRLKLNLDENQTVLSRSQFQATHNLRLDSGRSQIANKLKISSFLSHRPKANLLKLIERKRETKKKPRSKISSNSILPTTLVKKMDSDGTKVRRGFLKSRSKSKTKKKIRRKLSQFRNSRTMIKNQSILNNLKKKMVRTSTSRLELAKNPFKVSSSKLSRKMLRGFSEKFNLGSGSTRMPTTTRAVDSKRTPSSYLETVQKNDRGNITMKKGNMLLQSFKSKNQNQSFQLKKSLVLSNNQKLRKSRKKMKKRNLNSSQTETSRAKLSKSMAHKRSDRGKYYIPSSVVRKSKKSQQHHSFTASEDLSHLFYSRNSKIGLYGSIGKFKKFGTLKAKSSTLKDQFDVLRAKSKKGRKRSKKKEKTKSFFKGRLASNLALPFGAKKQIT